jgi:phospholipase C
MTDVMPQIKTIVMLMLENRSLDTMLGWLHDEPGSRVHPVPAGSPAHFDGIRAGMTNLRASGQLKREYTPAHGTSSFAQPLRVPRADPFEGMRDVQNQMYGDENGPPPPDQWGDDAPMSGFAADYPALWADASEVMGAYSRRELPVLYGLAEHFAVSDAWFCSVPTMTDPNRAFALCGTSLGATSDIPVRTFDAPTIFNGLDDAGCDWGIYWQYNGWLDLDIDIIDRQCWTADRFPQIKASLAAGNGRVAPYTAFLHQLAEGTLPAFSYIEPYWGWGVGPPDGEDFVGLQGNDYHPPTWVGPAEQDLAALYEALKNSQQWEHMLLIISFDEHGGTWDHVSPPSALAPDHHRSSDPDFDFTRLGPRVPTLLVSPYVVPGTVFRPADHATNAFDHTSFIATILAWAGARPDFMKSMGQRVLHAPRFDHALSPTPYLDNQPTFPTPVRRAGDNWDKGPRGWPSDVTYLPWDLLREVAAEVSGDGTPPHAVADEIIRRVRALQPATRSDREG